MPRMILQTFSPNGCNLMEPATKDTLFKVLISPIIFLVLLLVLPLACIGGLSHFLYGLWLNYRFRSKWSPQNKHILFVYSESPNWQPYIEENIIPVIRDKAVLLNWSKRNEWINKTPLEAKVMHFWGGEYEFNPMALIFMRKGKIQPIRFHKAFMDFKHGKTATLKEKELQLYRYLDSTEMDNHSYSRH